MVLWCLILFPFLAHAAIHVCVIMHVGSTLDQTFIPSYHFVYCDKLSILGSAFLPSSCSVKSAIS